MKISIIAAVAKNGAIGNKGQLLYHLPDDLKFFKKKTEGHTVIMGRKTFESLPSGPLKNRCNIVISTTVREIPGADVCKNLAHALVHSGALNDELEDEVFIIGGASVYKKAMEMGIVDCLYITEIDDTPAEADAFFPEIPDKYDVVYATCHDKDEKHSVPFSFVTYERITSE